ncbi:hypothetical protein BaRGS_00040485, partial [Batillaria attramentaria]
AGVRERRQAQILLPLHSQNSSSSCKRVLVVKTFGRQPTSLRIAPSVKAPSAA